MHVWAARDRWWEEQALLYEELRRIVVTFEGEEQLWRLKKPSVDLSPATQHGFRAYCLKRAAIFAKLAKEARIRFSTVDAHQKREAQALAIDPSSISVTGISGTVIAEVMGSEVEEIY